MEMRRNPFKTNLFLRELLRGGISGSIATMPMFQSVASERKEKAFLEAKKTNKTYIGNLSATCSSINQHLNLPMILKMWGVSRREKMITVPQLCCLSKC